jgi:hypothetical protein
MTVVVDGEGDLAPSWWGFLADLSDPASLNPFSRCLAGEHIITCAH